MLGVQFFKSDNFLTLFNFFKLRTLFLLTIHFINRGVGRIFEKKGQIIDNLKVGGVAKCIDQLAYTNK